MSYTDNRRDKNEREIVDFWRGIGALWKPQGRMAGLDGFLLYGGAWYPVEVKQPGKTLTQAERECRELIEDAGGEYHVIHSVREAAELLGLAIPPAEITVDLKWADDLTDATTNTTVINLKDTTTHGKQEAV